MDPPSHIVDTTRRSSTAGDAHSPAQIRFACPHCQGPLEVTGDDKRVCPRDEEVYSRVDGIWRFLPEERQSALGRFIAEYETVRRLEGRGSRTPEFYRALPFADLTGRFSANWRIRARSFRHLMRKVMPELARESHTPLKLLDLGAGNGWLSYRLAEAGHDVAAVDLCVNDFDGLGAHLHYPVLFTPIQAEFDALPFESGQFDAAIFNASFHYSIHYERTLAEALRVVKRPGCVIILDSPVYRDPESGRQMVRERQAAFQEKFGFPADALPSEDFLTFARLDELASSLGIRWRFCTPFYGLGWTLKPLRARLLGRREPARFMILVGQRQ